MKRIAVVLAIVLGSAVVGSSQIGDMMNRPMNRQPVSSTNSNTTLVGFIVDKPCISMHMNNLYSVASNHTTLCALKYGKKGLGVVSRNKWYPFDEKGSEKAVELLRKVNTQQGMIVSVTGKMKDETFVVSSIKEIKTDD